MVTDQKPSEDANERYWRSFGWEESVRSGKDYAKDSRIAKALEIALDHRKFEIELYWKRSAAFWLFVTAIAAALGFTIGGTGQGSYPMGPEARQGAAFALSCAGSVVSGAWWLTNASSKFWQRTWEARVYILEQAVLGPLYGNILLHSREVNGSHYSVLVINQWVSAYIGFVFLLAAVYFSGIEQAFPLPNLSRHPLLSEAASWRLAIVVMNVTFVALALSVIRKPRSGKHGQRGAYVESSRESSLV